MNDRSHQACSLSYKGSGAFINSLNGGVSKAVASITPISAGSHKAWTHRRRRQVWRHIGDASADNELRVRWMPPRRVVSPAHISANPYCLFGNRPSAFDYCTGSNGVSRNPTLAAPRTSHAAFKANKNSNLSRFRGRKNHRACQIGLLPPCNIVAPAWAKRAKCVVRCAWAVSKYEEV